MEGGGAAPLDELFLSVPIPEFPSSMFIGVGVDVAGGLCVTAASLCCGPSRHDAARGTTPLPRLSCSASAISVGSGTYHEDGEPEWGD